MAGCLEALHVFGVYKCLCENHYFKNHLILSDEPFQFRFPVLANQQTKFKLLLQGNTHESVALNAMDSIMRRSSIRET